MNARSHHAHFHTRTIPYTKMFLLHPICQGIQFRSACNVRQKIFYKQSWSQTIPLHDIRIYTTLYASKWSSDSTYEDIFCASLSPTQGNTVRDKTVTSIKFGCQKYLFYVLRVSFLVSLWYPKTKCWNYLMVLVPEAINIFWGAR